MEIPGVKIFVDNNIPSKIADDDRANKQEEDIVRKMWEDKNITLYTSLKCKQEAIATRNLELRERLIEVYKRLTFIPTHPTLSYGNVDFHRSHSTQDVLLTRLRNIFRSKPKKGFKAAPTNDADHIYEAKMADCEFFPHIG